MEQLRVRKIITESSNNIYYAIFEDGKLKTPIALIDETELNMLELEIQMARKNHNVLSNQTFSIKLHPPANFDLKINCIKTLRNLFGWTLKYAKDVSDGYEGEYNGNISSYRIEQELKQLGIPFTISKKIVENNG